MRIIGDVKVVDYNDVTERVTVGFETDNGFKREYFTLVALNSVMNDASELTEDGAILVEKIKSQGGIPWIKTRIETIKSKKVSGKVF